jgi:anti-anti-sigma factor
MALALLVLAEPRQDSPSVPTTAASNMGGGRVVVVLQGEADVSSRPVLHDMLRQVIAQQVGDVIIDLDEVTVVDSAAVGALAIGHQLLDVQGRKLTFRSPSSVAAEVLGMFGLAESIEAEGRFPIT